MLFRPIPILLLHLLIVPHASSFLTLCNINAITNTTLDCTRWIADAAVVNEKSRDGPAQAWLRVVEGPEDAEDVSNVGVFLRWNVPLNRGF